MELGRWHTAHQIVSGGVLYNMMGLQQHMKINRMKLKHGLSENIHFFIASEDTKIYTATIFSVFWDI